MPVYQLYGNLNVYTIDNQTELSADSGQFHDQIPAGEGL